MYYRVVPEVVEERLEELSWQRCRKQGPRRAYCLQSVRAGSLQSQDEVSVDQGPRQRPRQCCC